MLGLLADYGLEDFYLELSTRNEEKYVGSDEDWAEATAGAAERGARRPGLELVLDPGGAAFYAPKISVQARDALGRTWQMSTIQVDLQFPERFDLHYSAADGTRKRPYMIHRALFGSMERFFAILTEHYAGAFPAWLVAGAGGRHPGRRCVRRSPRGGDRPSCARRGIRAEVDHGDDRMQKKIRTHTTGKVPFLLLAGEKDVAAQAVSFRFRDGSQLNGVPVDDAVDAIVGWVRAAGQRLAERGAVHVLAAVPRAGDPGR